MVLHPNRRCIAKNCNEFALFGSVPNIRLHCEKHKHDNERNLIEKECSNCHLENIIGENGLCDYCSPTTKLQIPVKRKELHIRDVLVTNGFCNFLHDIIPFEPGCGKWRPDFIFQLLAWSVIIEVDEHQHKYHTTDLCERIRMINVSQALGHPVFWIRYNPDTFNDENGLRSQITDRHRQHILLEWLKFALENKPIQFAEVLYLFYDGCKERPDRASIQVLTAWDIV